MCGQSHPEISRVPGWFLEPEVFSATAAELCAKVTTKDSELGLAA